MSQADQTRLNDAVTVMMKSLESSILNPLQKSCYTNSAKCFDVRNSSSEQIQNCIQRSMQPGQAAQQVVQNELNTFQQRIERGMLNCQDKIKDELSSMMMDQKTNQDALNVEAQKRMEVCGKGVVNEYITALKGVEGRLVGELKRL